MWKDGKGVEPESVEAWLHENFATGKYNHVAVGCDANRSGSVFVTSIVVNTNDRAGSIFLWNREYKKIQRRMAITEKLLLEAQNVIQIFEDHDIVEIAEQYGVHCSAHVDVNEDPQYGSNIVFASVLGWVEATGVEVIHKPDCYAANSVSNRFAHDTRSRQRRKHYNMEIETYD